MNHIRSGNGDVRGAQTQVVNLRDAPYEIYIGRPGRWGNPYRITPTRSRAQAIRAFRHHCATHPAFVSSIRKHLTGKVLGCYCKPLPCHGDVYVEICDGRFGDD